MNFKNVSILQIISFISKRIDRMSSEVHLPIFLMINVCEFSYVFCHKSSISCVFASTRRQGFRRRPDTNSQQQRNYVSILKNSDIFREGITQNFLRVHKNGKTDRSTVHGNSLTKEILLAFSAQQEAKCVT